MKMRITNYMGYVLLLTTLSSASAQVPSHAPVVIQSPLNSSPILQPVLKFFRLVRRPGLKRSHSDNREVSLGGRARVYC